jgi:tripartite ATP-independent transporter DctP family solute receptor
MVRRRSTFAMLLLASLLTLSARTASAQDIQERTIRFGFAWEASHPIALAANKFGEIVAAKSGGKIKVRVFPGNQLGLDMQQMSALMGGTQQMMAHAPGQVSGVVKEFGLLDFPYIVANEQQADALLDGPAGQGLLDMLPPKGMVGLGYFENGFRHTTNSKRPIAKLEDFDGLKFRVQPAPIFIETFKSLKTNPVTLSFSELYTALEIKTVDAQENPLLNLLTGKLYEVQKYASLTGHVYGSGVILVSKIFWDRLSPTEQKILRDAFQEARDYERQESRRQAREAIAQLKAKGMQVNELSPAELDRIRKATQPVKDKFLAQYDPKIVKVFQTELERIKTK